ncbi:MAG: hypothetical protein QM676_13560 [Novosphingobium sp.]
MRKFLTAAVLSAATIALAGCGESKTYPISAGKVRSSLMSLRVPRVLLGMGAGTSMVTPTGDNDVRWTILTRDSKPLMSLIATLDATGDEETRVTVTAEPAKNNSKAAQGMAENPAIVKLYTKAMAEQIAAKLEKREFNMSAIQNELMAASLATMPKLQKAVANRMNEASEMESEMRDYDPSHHARPGRPTNDLNKYN